MNQNTQANNLGALDLISIISFLSQIENIQKDSRETKIVHSFIQAIAEEIALLHKENDRIEKKLDKILKELKLEG